MADGPTFDLGIVCLWFPHQQCRCFAIERVCGIWVQEQLREERLEDIQQICGLTSLLIRHTPLELRKIYVFAVT